MSFLRRFAHKWAMFKTYSEHKEHAAAASIADLLAEQLDHRSTPNYVEMSFTASDGRKYVCRVQKAEGQTPHQLRVEAEERASLWLQRYGQSLNTIEQLRNQLHELVESYKNNSGNEPSLSVFHREVDRASELLATLNGGE